MSTKRPTFLKERALMAEGYTRIVGVDEAGCGAFAGPIVAGAVMLPTDSRIGELRDSKLLSAKKREELYKEVAEKADAWSVGMASVQEIDEIGVRKATFLAMRRALALIEGIDFVLVDAWTIPDIPHKQEGIVRGDMTVKSIAAASIMAKVTRDRMMVELEARHPQYGFGVHKGYGTRAHREALGVHGASTAHRRAYVKNWAK